MVVTSLKAIFDGWDQIYVNFKVRNIHHKPLSIRIGRVEAIGVLNN